MSNEFVAFRDSVTGKVAHYPARFEKRFPSLERVDPSEAGCLDCLIGEPIEDEPVVVDNDETEEDD